MGNHLNTLGAQNAFIVHVPHRYQRFFFASRAVGVQPRATSRSDPTPKPPEPQPDLEQAVHRVPGSSAARARKTDELCLAVSCKWRRRTSSPCAACGSPRAPSAS